MSTLGATLLWCAVQVTIVGIAAVVAYGLLLRFGASTRGGIALAGLVTAAALAPIAFSPWPQWERPFAKQPPVPLTTTANPSSADTLVETSASPRQSSPSPEYLDPVTAAWSAFSQALNEPSKTVVKSPESPQTRTGFRWPLIVTVAFGLALFIGLARLVLGAWAVHRSIQRARPIDDASLSTLLDLLQAELSCRNKIELKESNEIATAATAGWRRHVILLPPDWRSWTETERRAVLAHEIAHVKRQDYATAFAANAALVVHFYHPLLHWLASRLRLEQELAADALAASVSGGRDAYLRTLAELALQRSDGRIAWPARAFLPSRRTFLRRIEMLRDPRKAIDRPAPLVRTLGLGGLMLFGLIVAGIRPERAIAQAGDEKLAIDTAETGDKAETEARDRPAALAVNASNVSPLAYIPPNAVFTLSVHPKSLLESETLKPLSAQFQQIPADSPDLTWKALQEAGAKPSNVESLALGILKNADGRGLEPSVIVFRLATPLDRSVLEEKSQNTTATLTGVVYQVAQASFIATPDERTLVLASNESTLLAIALTAQVNRTTSPWVRIDKQLDHPRIAILVNTEQVADELKNASNAQGTPQQSLQLMLAPFMTLIDETKLAGLGLSLDDKPFLKGQIIANDEAAANRAAETLRAVITLAGNTLRQLKEQTRRHPPEAQAVYGALFPLGEQILESAKLEVRENTVVLTAEAEGAPAAVATALILPALQQAREAARRTQSMSHLKQIALAFHNYHDVYGHFPPAVIEENGVKRSWRVEILPFVEQAALYAQYRKDEPWDSEHNMKLAETVVPVYKDPSDPSKPNSTSYFQLVGPNALASDKPVDVRGGGKGIHIRDITDGTSNTIMVIEAKQDVPWSKPEDIPFDPENIDALIKEELGGNHTGGFLAAFADGAVRFISENVDRSVFKGLVTPAGGEVIGELGPFPEEHPGAPPARRPTAPPQ